MSSESMNLDEDFSDDLDALNDTLTVYCEKAFTDYAEVINFIENADALLRSKGLKLDYTDVENIRVNLEDPSEHEAVNFIIPVYKDDEQSEYNLVVTYYQDTEDSEFEIEMELQYVWETDMEDDEFEEIDI